MAKQEHTDAERDVIIFVPGLGRSYPVQDVDAIGAKIAGSLERNSENVRDAYVVGTGVEETYADEHRAQVRQIVVKHEDGKRRVLAELYALDYHDNLRLTFEHRTLLGKCITTLLVLASTTPAYLRAMVTPGKSLSDKAQLFLAGASLGLVALYFLLLLLTLAGTVLSLGQGNAGAGAPALVTAARTEAQASPAGPAATPAPVSPRGGAPRPPTASAAGNPDTSAAPPAAEGTSAENAKAQPAAVKAGATPRPAAKTPATAEPNTSDADPLARGWALLQAMLPGLNVLVVLVAGLGAFSTKSLKAMVSEGATTYVTAAAYIQAAERKQSVNGQLAALIEYLLEKSPAYRRVHLVGFSFGSLIALDTLFPRHPPSLHLERVDTLVTIGCPFDMVRTFWPHYFEKRRVPGISGPNWINIYSRYDVLGSNFRDDAKEERAEGRVTARAFGMQERPDSALKPENVAYDLGMDMGRFPVLTVLGLRGFRAHGLYWEGAGTSELSCFDLAMPQLLLPRVEVAPPSDPGEPA